MSVTLDGHILFGGQQSEIELGSLSRNFAERLMPGLDGVLSVDLGRHGRKITQKGVLRAKSPTQMNDRINTISAYMDGDTHKLVTCDGEEFDDLRMDSFEVSKKRTDGSGVVVDYEITYTQLKVQQ
jgi:hypothetical protein